MTTEIHVKICDSEGVCMGKVEITENLREAYQKIIDYKNKNPFVNFYGELWIYNGDDKKLGGVQRISVKKAHSLIWSLD